MGRNGEMSRVTGRAAFFIILLLGARHLHSQSVIHSSGFTGRVNLLSSDSTILDAKEPRKDLPCSVTPGKPELGFDLKFHASYDVSIPMKDLNGGEDLLTMVFRVTPDSHPDDPVYLMHRIAVPKLDPKAGGDAVLGGSFVVGRRKVPCRLVDARPGRARVQRLLDFGRDSAPQRAKRQTGHRSPRRRSFGLRAVSNRTSRRAAIRPLV